MIGEKNLESKGMEDLVAAQVVQEGSIEVVAKDANVNNQEARRRLEDALEERRLQKAIRDFDFDLDLD